MSQAAVAARGEIDNTRAPWRLGNIGQMSSTPKKNPASHSRLAALRHRGDTVNNPTAATTLLVVTDNTELASALEAILSPAFELVITDGARQVTSLIIANDSLGLALVDNDLADDGSYRLCEQLKNNPSTAALPILLVADGKDLANAGRGLSAGAADYLTRPLNPDLVRARVATQLALSGHNAALEHQVALRTRALRSTLQKVIRRLGRAAEYRDNHSGNHIVRMCHFSRLIGKASGMDEETLDILFEAAPFHDLGKIGIPDEILLKPGKLDNSEWDVMFRHCADGAAIIGEHQDPLLRTAHSIALCHHEKWDGSGYPAGLKGNDIPLEARIIALCDVFDALISERPYKKAWPVEQALHYIEERAGSHFDPGLIAPLKAVLPELITISARYADHHGPLADEDLH